MRILLDEPAIFLYNKENKTEEEKTMSVEELCEFLLATLRDEVLAHCTADGDTIVLRFTDGTIRTVRIT